MNVNNLKRILITGGTSGLGLETARQLIKDGYIVCATGRNFQEGSIDSDRFSYVRADFSVLSDASRVVNKITEQIGIPDIIILNAGILSPPYFSLTVDGFELSFQVNLLYHLLMTELFARRLTDESKLNVISVTSPVYKYVNPQFKLPQKENYSAFRVYAESKYYLLMLGRYLEIKFPEKNIDFIGFNPGTFSSGIYRMQRKYFHTLYRIAAPFMKSPERVARNLVGILGTEELPVGKVYSSVTKKTDIGKQDLEESIRFIEFCSGLVSKAIHRVS